MAVETITLAGGCFWCLEAVYERVSGVESVESGYSNGHLDKPTYAQVCQGDTGHAEVVRLRFDSDQVSLRELLEVFFTIHDPTTLNRQGNDVGPQYRSGIYWSDPAHEATIRDVVGETRKLHGDKLVTEVLPLSNYHRAEDEHQHYFVNHPRQGYCSFVVAPKVAKFQQTFTRLLRR